MRRLLYSAILAIAAVLILAPAALAQETKFIPGDDIQGSQSLEEVRPENLNCVELAPGNAAEAQQKARAVVNQKSRLNLNVSEIQSAKKNLDENGNGAICEYTSSKANGVTFEDGSGYITRSIDYEVSRYSHGPNASIGPRNPPDANNVVVEYAGTAGRSHYDNIIGVAVQDPDSPWGYNYFIIYDFVETNRYNYTQTGINVLYRHERAHTRGWRHFEGNKRINGANCPRQDRLGRTYYYNGNRC